MTRYLFLCSDNRKASGGVAVIYQMVATLRRLGYDAAVMHQGRASSHPEHRQIPIVHTAALRRLRLRRMSGAKRLATMAEGLSERLRGGGLRDEVTPDAGDVIVIPEFVLDLALEAFPANRKIVLSQNSFSYVAACSRAIARGRDPAGEAVWNVATARICESAFDLVGAAPVAMVPASPNPGSFAFGERKEPLIAYMPRKRRDEARIVERALLRRGRLGGHALLSIDGMPLAQVREALRRSRFFLSLMRSESLGFPAAEAMASGCVVVGYTGVGAREYFDETTGIPVFENDTGALVEAIEGAVAEWGRDPSRLDALRREGCRVVHERYATEVFEAALEREWARIDAALAAG